MKRSGINRKVIFIFLMLNLSFLVYSFSIYMSPMDDNKADDLQKTAASKGQLVWQKSNCQSCHQLYGLGGYLGPDLTNVYSAPHKGETLIRAMVGSGVKQMPAFKLPEEEMKNLVEFLKSVDKSGHADPRKFRTTETGMIERK